MSGPITAAGFVVKPSNDGFLDNEDVGAFVGDVVFLFQGVEFGRATVRQLVVPGNVISKMASSGDGVQMRLRCLHLRRWALTLPHYYTTSLSGDRQ